MSPSRPLSSGDVLQFPTFSHPDSQSEAGDPLNLPISRDAEL